MIDEYPVLAVAADAALDTARGLAEALKVGDTADQSKLKDFLNVEQKETEIPS